MSPTQLDLFADRTLLLARARTALTECNAAAARDELIALARRYPDDPSIAEAAGRTSALADRLEWAAALPPASRAAALLDVAREPATPPELRRNLLLRVAAALEDAGGGAVLEQMPAGFYWLEAGATSEAVRSLEDGLRTCPGARLLALLGDAYLATVPERSRALYLEALVRDPYDVAFEALRDERVRELPDVARFEFELDADPIGWSAPVGVLTSVLSAPLLLPSSPGVEPTARTPALAAARAFMQAYREASSPHVVGREVAIDARRAMKRLAPTLFEAFLGRLRGARWSP